MAHVRPVLRYMGDPQEHRTWFVACIHNPDGGSIAKLEQHLEYTPAEGKCATLKLEVFFGGAVGAKWRQSGRGREQGVWREVEDGCGCGRGVSDVRNYTGRGLEPHAVLLLATLRRALC